jgi:hypothetical protein
MAIKHVVTMGFGSFGGVNYIPTIGYGNFEVVQGPYYSVAQGCYVPGGKRHGLFSPGTVEQGAFIAGGTRRGQV